VFLHEMVRLLKDGNFLLYILLQNVKFFIVIKCNVVMTWCVVGSETNTETGGRVVLLLYPGVVFRDNSIY